MTDLESLGFNVVGYGCTTCIGNSGSLAAPVTKAAVDGKLVVAAVLSGNRNFEGRISPVVKANYLASPPLVVAFALAGRADVDLTSEPIGTDKHGKPVFLSDIWPSQKEVADLEATISGEMFAKTYANVFDGNPTWNAIGGVAGDLYEFKEESTYLQDPPFFEGLALDPKPLTDIRDARILAILGDSVTTDHIAPAGDIAENSPAGRYFKARGVEKKDFNTYGARRGNDRVMARATFANIRLKNFMVPGVEGGVTIHLPSGERMDIFDAAERYKKEGVPLVVIAGKEYGSGSSRDWAAKGPMLLGVRAAIVESFERIHRSNLLGMGILPLAVQAGPERRVARPHRQGAGDHPGHQRDAHTATGRDGRGGAARRHEDLVRRHGAARHPGGDQLLPERRDLADGPAEDAEAVADALEGLHAAACCRLRIERP